jgi:hypothetical protein
MSFLVYAQSAVGASLERVGVAGCGLDFCEFQGSSPDELPDEIVL